MLQFFFFSFGRKKKGQPTLFYLCIVQLVGEKKKNSSFSFHSVGIPNVSCYFCDNVRSLNNARVMMTALDKLDAV